MWAWATPALPRRGITITVPCQKSPKRRRYASLALPAACRSSPPAAWGTWIASGSSWSRACWTRWRWDDRWWPILLFPPSGSGAPTTTWSPADPASRAVCAMWRRGEGLSCIVNPCVGKAPITPAVRKRRVLVVGAGPAGLSAALTLWKRGHGVIVAEACGETGRQPFARRPFLQARRLWSGRSGASGGLWSEQNIPVYAQPGRGRSLPEEGSPGSPHLGRRFLAARAAP